MLKEKFAKRLKEIRKSKKLTQEELAELVGVDFRYISLIENAKNFPSADLIDRLVSALDIEYEQLFAYEASLDRKKIENYLLKSIKKLDINNLKILYKISAELSLLNKR